eukprot:3934624-Rhodomonas_salina.2
MIVLSDTQVTLAHGVGSKTTSIWLPALFHFELLCGPKFEPISVMYVDPTCGAQLGTIAVIFGAAYENFAAELSTGKSHPNTDITMPCTARPSSGRSPKPSPSRVIALDDAVGVLTGSIAVTSGTTFWNGGRSYEPPSICSVAERLAAPWHSNAAGTTHTTSPSLSQVVCSQSTPPMVTTRSALCCGPKPLPMTVTIPEDELRCTTVGVGTGAMSRLAGAA